MDIGILKALPGRVAVSFILLLAGQFALAQDDGKVLYLSEYLHGDYYVADLGDVDTANPGIIKPGKLKLPRRFRRDVELGNHDVSPDGKNIVFAARNTSDYDWDIYTGKINLNKQRIRKVRRIVANAGGRDEDPRFSWDGSQVVYKCDGNICVYPNFVYTNPVVNSWCELWAPSIDQTGFMISYTKRCGEAKDDRVWQFNLMTGIESMVPAAEGSTDRFAHFLDDGRMVYSHIGTTDQRSSLWIYDTGYPSLLHDRTSSDDDPYPDKHDRNHIAFIGWEEEGYNLFIYRRDRGDSVRLTEGLPILSPVLFRR